MINTEEPVIFAVRPEAIDDIEEVKANLQQRQPLLEEYVKEMNPVIKDQTGLSIIVDQPNDSPSLYALN